MKNNSAFPVPSYVNLYQSSDNHGDIISTEGLTKREYMATHILASFVTTLANDTMIKAVGLASQENKLAQAKTLALMAITQADALIEELNK